MKTLKSITETFKAVAKHEQGKRKEGETAPAKKFINNTPVSLKGSVPAPTSGAQEFIDDHEIEMLPDANGNGDDVFKGDAVKVVDRKRERHGYNAKDSENVNEMSKAQMAKREEIVKGMKKNLSSFKDRYGDDAKSVMYATATKQAMKEELVDEAASPTAGTRLVKKYGDDANRAEVRYNSEYQEYQVHHYKDGKHMGEGPVSYHGDDKEDAHDTAKYSVEKRSAKNEEVQQFDSILEAVEAHQQMQEEQELVEAYAEILETIYESLESDEDKEHFIGMLESDDAFDDLAELVESVVSQEEVQHG